jgi:hypothetical protein
LWSGVCNGLVAANSRCERGFAIKKKTQKKFKSMDEKLKRNIIVSLKISVKISAIFNYLGKSFKMAES